MKNKFLSFMQNRYGGDELNICLIVLSLVLSMLSPIAGIFSSLSLVCLFYAIFRMFSKNIYARRCENAKILPYVLLLKAKWKDKGKNKIFLCPKCKRVLRIPKGKGKVSIKCPCGEDLKRKS